MAENKRPQGSTFIENNNYNNNNGYHNGTSNGNSNSNGNGNGKHSGNSTKRVDFTSLAKTSRKSSAKAKGSPMPMSVRPQNQVEDDGERESLGVVIDTHRMQLISPPPEEMLRRNPRHSGQFTPSLLAASAASSPGPGQVQGSTTKRKRTQQVSSSTLVRQENATTDTLMGLAREPAEAEQQQTVEATPNPKPRKQGRHARRMASTEVEMDSPTRGSFGSPSSANTDSHRTKDRDMHTTPSKPKHVLVQSPHARNPDADWIPPVSLSAAPAKRREVLSKRGSRRSATPIPPYEPPTDVFTPPRVVYMSPAPAVVSKSSKRKTQTPATATAKTKASTKKGKTGLRVVTTQVKQELPDIDLMAPMPPPSPSDDPLLLSGPPEPPMESSPLRRRAVSVPAVRRRSVSVQAQDEFAVVLPPSSPEPPLDSEDARAVNAFDLDFGGGSPSMDTEEDSMMRLDDPGDADVEPVRLFDLGLEDVVYGEDAGGAWSDSDDEMHGKGVGDKGGEPVVLEEGEGEFTGRWRMMKVRTKQDPPSSATRGRMEMWGRPISPFPKVGNLELLGEEDEEVRRMSVEPEEAEALVEQVRRLSVEPDDEDAREEEQVRRMSVEPEGDASVPDEDEEEDEEEREVREMSVESDDEQEDASNQEIVLPTDTRQTEAVREPSPQPVREPSPAPTVVERPSTNAFAFPSLESPEAGPSNYSVKPIPTQPLVHEDSQMQDVDVALASDGDDDESSSDADDEPGLVKITSADPRAAARAVAILKQYDYDCFTKLVKKKKQRRVSHSGFDDLAKESRRRDLSSSGITKSVSKNKDNRRSTLGMGVIGDRVFIPGSPVITLPELLKEAEMEVGRDLEHSPRRHLTSPQVWAARASLEGARQRDPFKTPLPDRSRAQFAFSTQDSPPATGRETPGPGHNGGECPWTKQDWKVLDACFTDQRLDLGATLEGAPEGALAPVDMVSVDDVLDRFIAFVGGEELVRSFGEAWSRNNLIDRTLALQRKQRAGNIARPTTPRSVSSTYSPPVASTEDPAALGGRRRIPSMEVPDFTPLGRRAGPPPRKSCGPPPPRSTQQSRPVLPQPVVHDAPFANLPLEKDVRRSSKRLPMSLLAPRYSHLLEEAISISKEGVTADRDQRGEEEKDQEAENQETEFSEEECSQDDISHDFDNQQPTTTPALRPTVGKRVKGFLFSYLPTLSSKPSATLPSRKPNVIRQPGLPLPPPDVLEKPRGPVTTPARQPVPRPKHPKELVHLNPAPAQEKSALPRPAKPRRMVELHQVPLPEEKEREREVVRPRRSSGSSVKDLVRGFEDMQKAEKERASLNLKRARSIEMGRKAGTVQDTRPRWKF